MTDHFPPPGQYKFEKDMEEARKLLEAIYKCIEIKPPDFATILLSDSRDWKLDYRGYHYVYFWLPTSTLTMNFGDYGTGTVPMQQWVNLAMRPGTVIKTGGQTTPVPIHVIFTDVRL